MKERHIVWRTPAWAAEKFERMVQDLSSMDPDGEEYICLVEEIKALPNYPYWYEPDSVVIHLETTSA